MREEDEWDFNVVFDYTIEAGQEEIIHPVDKAQPFFPPEMEIELERLYIGHGSNIYELCKSSRWWTVVEDQLNDDDELKAEVFEYEIDMQEGRAY